MCTNTCRHQVKLEILSLCFCVLYVRMCAWSLLRQLFPSRCSIPVTQLQTGPVILLLQICSQPPLSSSHQFDSEETSQLSHENPAQRIMSFVSSELRPSLPLLLMGPTVNMCSLCSLFSEYILLLCGQFCTHSTRVLIQRIRFHRHLYFRGRVLWRFSPLCKRLFRSRTGKHRSGGGPHRNPR